MFDDATGKLNINYALWVTKIIYLFTIINVTKYNLSYTHKAQRRFVPLLESTSLQCK